MLLLFGRLYDMERPLRDLAAEARQRTRHLQARPIADALHEWLILHRQQVPDGSATSKAIDLCLIAVRTEGLGPIPTAAIRSLAN